MKKLSILLFCIFFLGFKILAQESLNYSIAWNSDGSLLLRFDDYYNGKIEVFDPFTSEVVFEKEYLGDAGISWHPSNPSILAITSTEGETRIFDISTGTVLKEFGAESGGHSIAYSLDGRRLAVGQGEMFIDSLGGTGKLRLYDVNTAELINLSFGFYKGVEHLKWHPDGTQLAVFGGGIVEIIDTNDMSLIGFVSGLEEVKDEFGTFTFNSYQSFDWFPEGNLLVVAGAGIDFWDTSNFSELASIYTASSNTVAFSPNGAYLASAGAWSLEIIDVESRETIRELSRDSDVAISYYGLAWHPSGTMLAYIEEGRIKIVDTSTWLEILPSS